MTSSLHDGLRASELYVGTKALGVGKIRATCQQESKLRCADLAIELSVATFSDVRIESIRCFLEHLVLQRTSGREHLERCSTLFPKITCALGPRPLLAIFAIQASERF